jgi:hypothetical protein
MMKIKQNYLLKKILVSMLVLCMSHIGTNAQKVLSAPTNSHITSSSQLKADRFLRSKMMSQHGILKTTNNPDSQKTQPLNGKSKGVPRPNYYTFTGKGSWFTPSNWENNLVPPSLLKPGDHIIINAKGTCLLNNKTLFVLTNESSLEIKEGSILYISIGNNFIIRGGVFTNHGTVTILSGVLATKNAVAIAGDIKTTRMSGIGAKKLTPSAPAVPGRDINLKKK